MSIIPRRRFLGAQILLLVVVLMLHPPVFTLNQASTWSQTYGGREDDRAWALIQTTDGGYALAGTTTSYGAGGIDWWLVKTDNNGITQWNQTYGGREDDEAFALIQTTDGGYALAGTTTSYGTGGVDSWLVKTDSNGITQWNQTYGGENDVIWALIQTTDEGYALAGTAYSDGANQYDFWLVKTDSNGITQWSQTYRKNGSDWTQAFIQTTDEGYALAGDTMSGDFWLVKTDSNGITQWNRTYGGEEYDLVWALIQTTDEGYALAGMTTSYGAGRSDFWLVKTDRNGIAQWNRTYGGEWLDYAQALIQTTDGGYALAGTTSYNEWNSDFWLVKTDNNGIAQWNRTYGGEEYEHAFALIQTTDGGYALAGETTSYGVGMSDFWLVKTEGMGFSTTSTKMEGIPFLNTVLWYLTLVVIGSSAGLLTSRPVYRRYNKWRQERASSKALRERVNNLRERILDK
ncbi:MAG: hypothetical protein ACFFCZ_18405 [Promethearchaeota archaeon]